MNDLSSATIPSADDSTAASSDRSGGRRFTLSVIVLTYNEAHRLRLCLESVAWADEVLVIDGFSTDNTPEVAVAAGAKVLRSDLLGPKNPGGYSAQRNFGLSNATGDWILFLDADERVTPELRDEIERRLLRHDEGYNAYGFRRHEHYFGLPSPHSMGQGFHRRVIRSGRGRFNDRNVHEELVFEGPLGQLHNGILHFSKDTVEQYIATLNRYTSLEAKDHAPKLQRIPSNPIGGMFRTFLHSFIYLRSYREGRLGLLLSLMAAFYWFACWAKDWEVAKNAGRFRGDEPFSRPARFVLYVTSSFWHAASGVKSCLLRRSPPSSPKAS